MTARRATALIAVSLVMLGALYGCATMKPEPKWEGRSVDEAIARFGPPTRVSTVAGGDRVFIWEQLRRLPTSPGPGNEPSVQSDERVVALVRTAWVKTDGTIWSWSEGDTPQTLAPAPPVTVHGS